eukprot:8342563-Ditylum_brightwellii.AAC.1
MDFGIGSSNASSTLDYYDWVAQSKSFFNVMIHNDDGNTDSEGSLLPFEEGPGALEFCLVE